MGSEAALGILGSGIGTIGGIGNAANATSHSENIGDSWNAGGSSSSAYGYTQSDADSWAWQNAENWASAFSKTYGREASAQDVLNAYEANKEQVSMWQMQADYNKKEAQKARDFEAYMSNTAYQRAIADLKKAGLNPILAAGNMGASTPSAVSATSGLASSHKASAYADTESYSGSYGYNRGKSGSESHSKSENWSSGSSWQSGGSHNEGFSDFEQKTQLKSIIDGAIDLFSGKSSAKKQIEGHGGGGGKIDQKQQNKGIKFKYYL